MGYQESCAIALGLGLVGGRWTLRIVAELLTGPKQFGFLRSAIGGISANLLTKRLRSLEVAGIVGRRTLPGRKQIYELTPWGLGLDSFLSALSAWSHS